MEIRKRHAEAIVNTLKSVISEDINFISPEGIIIASSNESRVGQFHAGAVEVATTRSPLIINSDNEYEGSRKGINLPVFYEQNLVAIVGITGNAKDIIQFSNIIVKMSEILIKEHFLNTQKQFKRENNRVILELITKDSYNHDLVKTKMEELSYKPDAYKFFVVWSLQGLDTQNIELSNLIYNSIEKRIDFNDLLSRDGSSFLMLATTNKYEMLEAQLKVVKEYLEKKYNLPVRVGISESISSVKEFNNAYKQARMVVALGKDVMQSSLKQYDSYSLDLLFEGFSNYIQVDYSRRVFANMNNEDIIEAQKLIQSYIKNNGSLNETSEDLFIHKNTLQYRLNRIHQLTGYNPRVLDDLIKLYIAIQLSKK
jgi:carbohydrate diacid regulator